MKSAEPGKHPCPHPTAKGVSSWKSFPLRFSTAALKAIPSRKPKFVGLEVFTGIILVIILKFLDVEKNITKEQAEIKARHEKAEA